MRVEDIRVGMTYAGRRGPNRTVVAVPPVGRSGDISYHTGNPEVTRNCWCYTFAGWAKGSPEEIAAATAKQRVTDAAPALLEVARLMVADEAFADLCAGIGEEPRWLKLARLTIAAVDGAK